MPFLSSLKIKGSVVLLIALSPILAAGSTCLAGLELGRIDEYKLKGFAEYFEPYLGRPNPRFADESFEKKILSEAESIRAWLEDKGNWPPQSEISGQMLTDTAKLYHYFSRLNYPQARENALDYYRLALEKDPENFDMRLCMAELLSEMGDTFAYEGARQAVEALELKEEEAAARKAYYIAALGFYHSGFFKKARFYLKKQMEIDPDNEDVSDLDFVFESLIRKWGYEPDFVAFERNDAGDTVPVPQGEGTL